MDGEQSKASELTTLPPLNQKATSRLDEYMSSSHEQFLRAHQIDVMDSLRSYFATGEKAGYISLPTGSGKTVLIVELAKALGIKTIVVSPSQTILRQTSKAFDKYAPYLDVSDYYSRSKELGGDVLNTTYQSLQNLIDESKINPQEVELLICDEAHTALGEKRHTVFDKFPNAILLGLTATPYFQQLEGYKQRELITGDEFWAKLFAEKIHDMTLEEAMERGILAPLDVHLIETDVKVGKDIKIKADGEYNQTDIQNYLIKEARDYLTIGMVGGLDKVPEDINLSSSQKEEIEKIYEKIKDKRTVIFGFGVAHIEALKKKLQEAGITAETVHGGKEQKERERILELHKRGEIPVLLGVDLLRLGWDSPETEVGIYLAPTHSGIVAVQELGRILRTSPDKEKAIAVQLVDKFEKRIQSPVLIPNIFDPYYVLRGSAIGAEQTDHKYSPTGRLIVTFSGMNIQAIVEQARSKELLQRRFKDADIAQIVDLINGQVKEIQNESPDMGVVEFYREIAEKLSLHIPNEVHQVVKQAYASLDSNIAAQGRKALLFLNMKTILSAAEPFLSEDKYENEDLIHEGIAYVMENLGKTKYSSMPNQVFEIYSLTKKGMVLYIAEKEGIPQGWAASGVYKKVRDMIEKGESESKIIEETGVSNRVLQLYIKRKISDEKGVLNEEKVFSEVLRKMQKEDIEKSLSTLTEREKNIIILRFGLGDEDPLTLEEISHRYGFTRSWSHQLVNKILAKLRHPSRTENLKEYVREEYIPHGDSTKSDSLPNPFSLISAKTKEHLSLLGIIYVSDLTSRDPDQLELDEKSLENLRNAVLAYASTRSSYSNKDIFRWSGKVRKILEKKR